ncbi:hypothetical protein GCM10025863_07310 [Microbacterium suwonense]|uniref:Uncharacterized protein n=1 Tax=Microbacterium suwonense TaxID=683047 RepID=A0ABM8FR39_9MICO|nr:hypothetical protein GCM10025863_07310 [Microbacterium suwonense]
MTHPGADGDDRGRVLVGESLDAAGDRVPTAELLGLPRPQRLQAVRGEHMRNAVQLRREMACEVRVPGVTVHDIRSRNVAHHREIRSERLHGGVGIHQFGRRAIGMRARLVTVGTERTHLYVDALPERSDEFRDVHARTTVDLRRVLLGDDVDSHDCTVVHRPLCALLWSHVGT